jgi:hypothetical protein
MTGVLGVGLSSSGDNTAIVPPAPVPGGGGGVEPAPVGPPPGDFIKPSTPQLIGAVQGINVLWDGLNVDGDLWPYDTSYIEVHSSTAGTGFTLGTATLQGRLARPGGLYVGGLTAGSTYHFRFRGADPAGNFTEASDAASGQTGLTTVSDYGVGSIGTAAVSFNARTIGGVTNTVGSATPISPVVGDVWLDSSPGTAIIHKVYDGSTFVTNAWGSASIAAGQITALQVAAGAITAGAIAANAITAGKIDAGAITAEKIAALTITGDKIAANTISAEKINVAFITASDVNGNVTSISGSSITSGTITGRTVQSSSGGNRIVLNTGDTLDFFSSSVKRGDLYGVTVGGIDGIGVTGALDASNTISAPSLKISGANVDMIGVFNNNTTGIDEVGIVSGTGRLRRISSSQAIKYDVTPITGALSQSVDSHRVSEVVTVDPLTVLDVAVTEFSVIDDGEPTDRRVLGFIAEDVADKLPIAVSRDADGQPLGVLNTSLVAALLAVAQQQQATITDLRTRIEALEA